MRDALWKNVIWGIGQLAWSALACWLIALVVYTLNAKDVAAENMPGLPRVALFYASAALAGGVILGLARPLTRTPLGKGFVGFLTALPISFVVFFLNPFGEPMPVDGFTVGIAIFIAAVFGPAAAAYVAIRNRDRAAKRRDP
jgi:hypothetical protein